MNSDSNTATTPAATEVPPPALPDPSAPTQPSTGLPVSATGRRRVGKIARLPKALRDKINVMLQDGLTYREIIEAVDQEAPGLNEENLTRWKAGGHQEWLREQQAQEALRLKQDFILDLVRSSEGCRIQQACLQISATGIAQVVLDTNMRMLRGPLEEDPDKLTRLLNAAARLSDSEVRSERHLREEVEHKAQLARDNNPAKPRIVTEETLRKAEKALKLL